MRSLQLMHRPVADIILVEGNTLLRSTLPVVARIKNIFIQVIDAIVHSRLFCVESNQCVPEILCFRMPHLFTSCRVALKATEVASREVNSRVEFFLRITNTYTFIVNALIDIVFLPNTFFMNTC